MVSHCACLQNGSGKRSNRRLSNCDAKCASRDKKRSQASVAPIDRKRLNVKATAAATKETTLYQPLQRAALLRRNTLRMTCPLAAQRPDNSTLVNRVALAEPRQQHAATQRCHALDLAIRCFANPQRRLCVSLVLFDRAASLSSATAASTSTRQTSSVATIECLLIHQQQQRQTALRSCIKAAGISCISDQSQTSARAIRRRTCCTNSTHLIAMPQCELQRCRLCLNCNSALPQPSL